MASPRIPVQLVSDTPVDETLTATLNRFHFTRIRLVPEPCDPAHSLAYGPCGPTREAAGAFMPRADCPLPGHTGRRGLRRDYFQAIGTMLGHYLHPTSAIPNKVVTNETHTRPAADALADEFEQGVLDALGLDIPRPRRTFALAMTHDVDCVGRHRVSDIKSGGVFLVNALRTRGTPAARPFLRAAARFLAGRPDYFGFPLIMDAARRLDFRPTFFLYARLPGHNGLDAAQRLKQVNPNYDLATPLMRRALDIILKGEGEIGLHGSYRSPEGGDLLAREKERLEAASGVPCRCVRQHFLRSFGRTTLDAYSDIGLNFDSTCGFVYDNGYFCGTCRPFYASRSAGGPGVVVVPMVFMDAVPLYFRPATAQAISQELRGILATLKQYGGFATANFHQRMLSALPQVRAVYEETVTATREMGGAIAPLGAVDELYPRG